MFRRLLPFLILLSTLDAGAGSLCDYYRDNSPDLYKFVCTNGRGSSRPAGATSSFSSAFNLSAASLPSEPSSYGLEVLGNYARLTGEKAPIFSIVKGFKKFGTGISTSSNNTFYGDDVVARQIGETEVTSFTPHETAKGSLPNLNIGTAISLWDISPSVGLNLGTSLRYNKTTATWGGGPALSITSPYITLGAAVTRERISNYLDPIVFTTLQASLRLWVLELEYNQLKNNSIYNQSPIHIFTLTATISRLILTVAERHIDYYGIYNGGNYPVFYSAPQDQTHFAVQFLFSKSFSAGFLYNYIPGATSLGAQFYL